MKIIILLILTVALTQNSHASLGEETGLKIPRYVSLKSNDANIRVGPSKNYPIVIKYIKKNYPLKIIEEYQDWRKVEDFNKNTGWIHKSLISGTRTGLILSKDKNYLELFNTLNGKAIGKIGRGNIVYLEKCKINWCKVSIDSFNGWLDKQHIWGVDTKEIVNINFLQRFEDLYWKSVNFFRNISR